MASEKLVKDITENVKNFKGFDKNHIIKPDIGSAALTELKPDIEEIINKGETIVK